MPTSLPSARTSLVVSPSPMSRSPACSSAARLMIRSSASRLMRSFPIRLWPCPCSEPPGDVHPLPRLVPEEPPGHCRWDWDGEDRRRVVLGSNLVDRLQIAQLNGRRLRADDMRGLRQLFGCLQLPFGVDDFRT